MYYELSIGGSVLDNNTLSLIEEITHEDFSSGSDLLTIKIIDPDFVFIDSKMFVEEQQVTFKGGWSDESAIEFEGYISIVDVDFPEEGSPELVIHCMDNTHLMNRVEKKRTWNNKKRSDVVKEIYAEYGLSAEVDDTDEVIETITQSEVADIQFIIDLAGEEKEEFLVYVEKNKGYFVKKKVLDSPQETLSYKEGNFDIKSFSPRVNKEVKKEEVNKSEINDLKGEVETAKATNDVPREAQGDTVVSSSKKSKGSMTYDKVSEDWYSNNPQDNRTK